jgi:hypothetical protein
MEEEDLCQVICGRRHLNFLVPAGANVDFFTLTMVQQVNILTW